MTPEEAREEAQSFVEHMLRVTLVLVRKGISDPVPNNWTSGFLLQSEDEILAISNGHFSREGDSWWIELRAEGQERPPLIRVPGTLVRPAVSSSPTVYADASVWQFPASTLSSQGRTDAALSKAISRLTPYTGPIADPDTGELYGFAAWNRNHPHPYVPIQGSPVLEHEASFEVLMEFEGIESVRFTGRPYPEEAYRFGLARPHRGDEYYSGACGAPIAGRDGKIVSIVIGGNREKNCIFGLPLSRHLL